MNVLKAVEIWLGYHKAHSKKKILFEPMNQFYSSFVGNLINED
jgi:hypothetical protein